MPSRTSSPTSRLKASSIASSFATALSKSWSPNPVSVTYCVRCFAFLTLCLNLPMFQPEPTIRTGTYTSEPKGGSCFLMIKPERVNMASSNDSFAATVSFTGETSEAIHSKHHLSGESILSKRNCEKIVSHCNSGYVPVAVWHRPSPLQPKQGFFL